MHRGGAIFACALPFIRVSRGAAPAAAKRTVRRLSPACLQPSPMSASLDFMTSRGSSRAAAAWPASMPGNQAGINSSGSCPACTDETAFRRASANSFHAVASHLTVRGGSSKLTPVEGGSSGSARVESLGFGSRMSWRATMTHFDTIAWTRREALRRGMAAAAASGAFFGGGARRLGRRHAGRRQEARRTRHRRPKCSFRPSIFRTTAPTRASTAT